MNLIGQNIRHINTITHDGKVIVFGTIDGTIYYSIKRSGFEDSAVEEGVDPRRSAGRTISFRFARKLRSPPTLGRGRR